MTPTIPVVNAMKALSTWINNASADISRLSTDIAVRLEKNLLDDATVVDTAALAGLDDLSTRFLKQHSFAVGAGAIFSATSIERRGHVLEWWCRTAAGAIEKFDFDLTPGSERFYDYERMPFFSQAKATGEQTLWGPYVDYLGFEEYILTFTTPFAVKGQFAGVAGCDIRINDLEAIFMPILRGVPGDAALVNASNRVILGNSGTFLVGERIKFESQDLQRLALEVPHLGLSLVFKN